MVDEAPRSVSQKPVRVFGNSRIRGFSAVVGVASEETAEAMVKARLNLLAVAPLI